MQDPTDDERLAEYLAFVRQRPDFFPQEPGAGIKILLDPADIRRVERDMGEFLRARGLPESCAKVGIVAQDAWVIVVREAVEFPDGARRTHSRIFNRTLNHGVAILPLLGDRVVLTRQFRHALQNWSLEIPRGGVEVGKSPAESARAEVEEEIGGDISELVELPFMNGSTNVYAHGVYTYFARLTRIGGPQIAEAITSLVQVTVRDFENLIRRGEIVDAFTIGAFAHARLRGLL